MKFSISTWNYLTAYKEKADLLDAIDEIVQQGFGLELFLDWRIAPDLLAKSNWALIRKICRNNIGLSLHSRLISFFDMEIMLEDWLECTLEPNSLCP